MSQLPSYCPGKPVSINGNHPRVHNLNLDKYNYEELLNIFDLPEDYGEMELKRAKKKVLMMHPDKSGFPNEYFIFYRDAFNLILKNYELRVKTEASVHEKENLDYSSVLNNFGSDMRGMRENGAEVQRQIRTMTSEQFNSAFNELYEKHLLEKDNDDKFQWFKEDQQTMLYGKGKTIDPNNVDAFDEIKRIQQQTALVQYKGVMDYQYNAGSSYYGNDKSSTEYISSDPFGSMKYDDIRKVHRDQTVFTVSEKDIANMSRASTLEQCRQERSMAIPEWSKEENERLLREKELREQREMARRIHESQMKDMETEKKISMFESAFLMLGFGKENANK